MRDRKIIEEKKAYANLLRTCLNLDPKSNETIYLTLGKDFTSLSQEVRDKINAFKLKISNTSLIALVLLWAHSINSIGNFDSENVEMMNDLIEKKIIFPKSKKNHNFLTLSDLEILNSSTIESIRCYKEWSIEKRENYVSFYIEFIRWLSTITFGYVSEVFDIDRVLTQGRLLKFETYIKIIKDLSLRERILAKICYLGGSRPLEDIFSLKIEDIDFLKQNLRLSAKNITFPKHLLEDLKEYLDPRKKGLVFINRAGIQVDLTVPYRALKTVINKMDLDKSFTFKDFMKSS